MIRVVVVDDHATVRSTLRELLDAASDIEVVGEAADGSEVLDAVEAARPDVVLMDIRMPRVGGLEATRRLHASHPRVRILVMSAYPEDQRMADAVLAGASGAVEKSAGAEALRAAVRDVHEGRTVLDAKLEARLAEAEPVDQRIDRLTPRELDIVRLLARGRSNRAIADELGLSEKTVKNHVSRVLAKLEVTDRTQAALYAVRQGIADPL